MDNPADNRNPEREQFIKQFDAGQYLKQLRGDRSLAAVCKQIGVTPAHLSEIERGRMPSDHLISTLARVYEVDEDGLFRRWGKIPILTKDEILARKSLQRLLSEMSHNSQLTEAEKDELYDNMYELYRSFIQKKNQEENFK
ncbi:helix-turn-helix domain-containing protein [Desulfosporosinus metallidurans]|uniref:Transcriptional regulator, XRE family n=1 Tax=Desulfosporosinus metallidurans TaxID=1888891 RepID=A0A1Q8QPZ6_9FIRM|nr:helix-turn-helix transcriptional regulator [Desulfosporosinus metallidurans]OLN29414.1 transcriptional regulator, XRE family [Desulfosporosinus metallidurans]